MSDHEEPTGACDECGRDVYEGRETCELCASEIEAQVARFREEAIAASGAAT